jgi:hypothetical protein
MMSFSEGTGLPGGKAPRWISEIISRLI